MPASIILFGISSHTQLAEKAGEDWNWTVAIELGRTEEALRGLETVDGLARKPESRHGAGGRRFVVIRYTSSFLSV